MPGINLEALKTGDLRRLLKVAHARHDGPLADRLEWEIAARGTSVVHPVGPFATLPDDEPDEPGFRMDATDDASIDPEPRAAVRRDPETGPLELRAPERRAQAPAPAPAARMADAQAPERSQWLSIGLAALAGCLVTAAVVFAAERMGERVALKRLLAAQEAAGAPTRSLAPLQQAFSAPEVATPPEVRARPVAVAQAVPKKVRKKPPARASAPESEVHEWEQRPDLEEPIY